MMRGPNQNNAFLVHLLLTNNATKQQGVQTATILAIVSISIDRVCDRPTRESPLFHERDRIIIHLAGGE